MNPIELHEQKEQCLGYLSRMDGKAAQKLFGTNERGIKMMLSTRRISKDNMEILITKMAKDGIKVKAVEKPALSPNELLAQAATAPQQPPQGPEEEGGITIMSEQDHPTQEVFAQEEIAPSVEVGEGRRLMICFPCYRTTNPATLLALMALYDRTKMMFSLQNGTIIINARNRLADTFLRSECEWSFWVDDDIIPPYGNEASFRGLTGIRKNELSDVAAGTNAILRLVGSAKQRNAKIMSGLYYGRNRFGRGMFAEAIAGKASDNESRVAAGKNLVTETAWAAAG